MQLPEAGRPRQAGADRTMAREVNRNGYSDLEERLGHRFRRKQLLEMALTHRSYRFERDGVDSDNQRLEFLGDAVLGMLAAAHCYRHSDEREGVLTTLRSRITTGKALADIARQMGLGSHLRMGKGESLSGGGDRDSNLADALEALIGAVYLDSGVRACERLFLKHFAPLVAERGAHDGAHNPKGRLQEYTQNKWRRGPTYRVVKTQGPGHARVFTVEVVLPDGSSSGGKGSSRRSAEELAAREMLRSVGI